MARPSAAKGRGVFVSPRAVEAETCASTACARSAAATSWWSTSTPSRWSGASATPAWWPSPAPRAASSSGTDAQRAGGPWRRRRRPTAACRPALQRIGWRSRRRAPLLTVHAIRIAHPDDPRTRHGPDLERTLAAPSAGFGAGLPRLCHLAGRHQLEALHRCCRCCCWSSRHPARLPPFTWRVTEPSRTPARPHHQPPSRPAPSRPPAPPPRRAPARAGAGVRRASGAGDRHRGHHDRQARRAHHPAAGGLDAARRRRRRRRRERPPPRCRRRPSAADGRDAPDHARWHRRLPDAVHAAVDVRLGHHQDHLQGPHPGRGQGRPGHRDGRGRVAQAPGGRGAHGGDAGAGGAALPVQHAGLDRPPDRDRPAARQPDAEEPDRAAARQHADDARGQRQRAAACATWGASWR
jgi:hypothetical protein